jgi:hypothetical protein
MAEANLTSEWHERSANSEQGKSNKVNQVEYENEHQYVKLPCASSLVP